MNPIPAAIGRYEVKAFIARGGMGMLYLATDPVLQRQVAIKLLRESDNDDLRVRFTREARSAANLRHRNIVTIFDVGDHNGQPFMAMEYIQGQTLTALIRAEPPPSTIRRLQLTEDLCDGLSYAHKRGVVHRDIKPANLMVDAEGSLKILDFGIARAAAEAGMTQVGDMVGTLNYMSPEQVAGGEIDGRCDMFAVGAVLYELLTRRQAFPGSIDGGVLNRILNGEPEPLETLCPHLDPAIARIVRRALAKSPAARFADLQQMRVEITQARQALEATAFEDVDVTISTSGKGDTTGSTPRPTKRGTDREELARRRSQQIEDHVTAARHALAAGNPDEAIARCEEALLLDPNEARALDIADRARLQRDETSARNWLDEAHTRLKAGELTSASNCVREARALMPDSTEAIELGRVIAEARLAQDRERQRQAAVQGLVGRARAALADDPAAAVALCDEALALVPAHRDAAQIKERAQQIVAAREREERDRQANTTADEARQLFDEGRHADALALLEEFWPAHPVVSQLWTELSAEAARLTSESETMVAQGDRTILSNPPEEATVFVPRRTDPFDVPDVERTILTALPDQTLISPASEPTITRPVDVAVPAEPVRPAAAPVEARRQAPADVPPQARETPRSPQGATAPRSRAGARSPVGMYAAAAVLLVAIAAGAFVLLRDSPADTPVDPVEPQAKAPVQRDRPVPTIPVDPPPVVQQEPPLDPPKTPLPPVTVPPAPLPEPGVPAQAKELARLRQEAARSLKQSEYRNALDSAVAGLRIDPADRALTNTLQQIESLARGDAVAARNAVPAGRPPTPSFTGATQAFDSAQRASGAGRHEEATRGYWRAREMYVLARNEPAPAPPTVKPTPGNVETTTPATPPDVARAPGGSDSPGGAVVTPTPSTAKEPAREPPAPARPQLSDEEQIRAVIESYAQAYRERNLGLLRRVYPRVDSAAMSDLFQKAVVLDLTFSDVRPSVMGSGATATARMSQSQQMPGAQKINQNFNMRFTLQKSDGTWTITDREGR